MKKVISSLILIFISILSFGQISVTNTQTPADLVNDVLAGPGVTISNITYNGSAPNANNTQPQAGFFDANGSGFALTSGVVLSTGNITNIPGSGATFISTDTGGGADADLTLLSDLPTNDAVIIEFDFIPVGDSVSFKYVLASEEYPEYSPSSYNDVFGFFLSGPGINGPYSNNAENIAFLPNNLGAATINNINPTTNPQFYVDLASNTSVSFDGSTVVLTTILNTNLQCGETYHFKIALADGGDHTYDTAIFLEANSFTSAGASISIVPTDSNGDPLINNELYEGCTSAQIIMVNPAGYTDSSYVVNITTSGTATNGIDYSTLNTSYIIPPGQDTLIIDILSISDADVEGTETIIIETYYINDCNDTIWVNETINILDVAPDFNTLTIDSTITCPSEDGIQFTALTDGGVPNLTYDWGTFGTNQITLVPANISGTTSYPVTITDACGIVSTGTFSVTLNETPPPAFPTTQVNFELGDDSQVICPAENIDIVLESIVTSYDPGNETYSWYTIDNPLTTSDTIPLTTTTNTINVSPNVLTWYYVDVFDGCYTMTDSAKVDIGSVDITAINITDAVGCASQGTYTAGEIEILPSIAGWTYSITSLGITTGPQVGNTFTNLNGPQSYTVTVTDDQMCSTVSTVTVSNSVVTVTAGWDINTLTPITCFGDANGFAEVTNIQGGLSNGPYTVTWTNSGAVFNTSNATVGNNIDINNLTAGNWVVTILEPSSLCTWSENFIIDEPDELILTPTAHEPICFGNNDGDITASYTGGNGITQGIGTLDITNSAGNILNNGPNSPTVNQLLTDTYTITAIDDKGCSTSISFLLDQPGELAIDFTLTNPNCYGKESGTIIIDNVYNYSDYHIDSITYQWQPDPHGTSGNGAELGNYLRFIGEGAYELKITDSTGCFKFFDFEIEYPDSIYWDELDFHPTVCRNQIPFDNGSGQLYAAAAGGSNGDGLGTNFNYVFTELATGDYTAQSTWGGRDPGWYIVSASNDLGCFMRDSIYVDSLSPEAIFTMDLTSNYGELNSPNEGTAVIEITLENESINYNFANLPVPYGNDSNVDTNFVWTFGLAGQAPTEVNNSYDDITQLITKQYTTEGVYEVCLIVTENMNGCVDTTCQEFIVHDIPALVTPNVFTPGQNGVNDYFYFSGDGVIQFSCQVFNSWGNQVFEFYDINEQWDGTNMSNGSQCSDGTYFYTFALTYSNGTTNSGQGNIQLIGDTD